MCGEKKEVRSGKRKAGREYPRVRCQKASISAIAVVLSFEETADIVARRKKRESKSRGQQNKIDEETQCFLYLVAKYASFSITPFW